MSRTSIPAAVAAFNAAIIKLALESKPKPARPRPARLSKDQERELRLYVRLNRGGVIAAAVEVALAEIAHHRRKRGRS